MELDKRIKALTDIQSVTSGCHDWEFMTKKGYFANSIFDFKALKRLCVYGEYADWREHNQCFLCKQAGDETYYSYFLPESRLLPEEPKKKYRPYSLEEFIGDMNLGLGPWIRMRPVGTKKECKFLYTGYLETKASDYICLGCFQFDFVSLFQNYEICINGEWQPFGTEVKEDE